MARQRRIVDRAFAVEARKKTKKKSSLSLSLGDVTAEKRPEYRWVLCATLARVELAPKSGSFDRGCDTTKYEPPCADTLRTPSGGSRKI